MDDYFRYLNDEQMSNKVGVDHQLAGTCLFSIFALQPSKTRPFPIKNNGHFGSGYTCVCLSKILLDVMTPFFFSRKKSPQPQKIWCFTSCFVFNNITICIMNDQAKTSPSSREENGCPYFFPDGACRVKRIEWGIKR